MGFANKYFLKKIPSSTAELEKLRKDLKSFPRCFFFSDGLGRCNKMAVKLELKNDNQPVFKKKRNVPFVSLTHIDKDLQRLEQMGVISKIQYK